MTVDPFCSAIVVLYELNLKLVSLLQNQDKCAVNFWEKGVNNRQLSKDNFQVMSRRWLRSIQKR